ncbi:hypothetical protein NM688_g5920 [Phlebia brevispora]|uniref:Uncharacterized protein n=1 Tax=Phlebia brevispora TaxID=194682 RepID=A0ACC1SMV6_9APHY|nr:hypothetical protein NM688_g5920 [Phlebia brevispora]
MNGSPVRKRARIAEDDDEPHTQLSPPDDELADNSWSTDDAWSLEDNERLSDRNEEESALADGHTLMGLETELSERPNDLDAAHERILTLVHLLHESEQREREVRTELYHKEQQYIHVRRSLIVARQAFTDLRFYLDRGWDSIVGFDPRDARLKVGRSDDDDGSFHVDQDC